jgi:hypothetical protein
MAARRRRGEQWSRPVSSNSMRLPSPVEIPCPFGARSLCPHSRFSIFSGGYAGGVTPVPIPNTEVKPSRADGTAGETLWESRTLPELFLEAASRYEEPPLSFLVRRHEGLFRVGHVPGGDLQRRVEVHDHCHSRHRAAGDTPHTISAWVTTTHSSPFTPPRRRMWRPSAPRRGPRPRSAWKSRVLRGLAGPQRQHRLRPLERLYLGLLIHGGHDRFHPVG